MHDIEFAPSLEIILNETLPCLLSLQREGKVKYIGATGYPLSELRDIVEISPIPLNTVLSYCRNTLIDSALGKYIDFFQVILIFITKENIITMEYTDFIQL